MTLFASRENSLAEQKHILNLIIETFDATEKSPDEEIVLTKLTKKTGQSNGHPWTRYSIKDENGEWYSTFNLRLVSGLERGQKARIQYESKPVNGRVVKTLTAIETVL